MNLRTLNSGGLTLVLLERLLTNRVWLMVIFLLLACLVPFSGGTVPFRGDPLQLLDPFSFSLLTPSMHAFGPHSMLALAGLFLITGALITWRDLEQPLNLRAAGDIFQGAVLPVTATLLYLLFLVLSLPLIGHSSAFRNIGALGITILDLVLLGAMLALIVDFALAVTIQRRLRPLVGWMVAGAVFLTRGMTDAFIIAPEVRELVEADWTLVAWHLVLVIIAATIYVIPGLRIKH